MEISFVHCSDLHLGYNQFNQEERFHDFGQAFANIVDYAIDHQVNYLLLAGDVFNKRMINAKTLSQAIAQLTRLKIAGIEVIAIEGNHDKVPYGEDDSWMSFLNDQGYFYLLGSCYDEQGKLILKEWSPESPGNILVKDGIRFIGLGYLGSMTEKRIEELAEILDASPDFTVLLLHSAINRLMHLGGISLDKVTPLKNRVNYLAMGHVHEFYQIDDWIFNPGAPENWDLGEADKVKGFFHVRIKDQKMEVEHISGLQRPVINLRLDLTGLTSPEQVYEKLVAELGERYGEYEQLPMIRVVIYGQLPFSPLAISGAELEEIIKAKYPCLLVEFLNQTVLAGTSYGTHEGSSRFERETLEKQVLHQLILERAVVPPAAVDQVVQTARQFHDLVLGAESLESEALIGMATKLSQHIKKLRDKEEGEIASADS